MSMLSAQCDELREMADQLQEHGTFVGFGGTTNTDPLMHGAAIVMREAADTIWELRGMVHKERAEADRLREELEAVGTAAYLYGRDDLKAERDKLRELVRDYYMFEHGDCHSCRYHDECLKDESFRCIAPMRLADRMRELGVDG